MAQFASDAFTDTTGTALASHTPTGGGSWTLHTSYSGGAVITDANRARGTTSGGALFYHSGTPASADYSVNADLFFKETDGGAGNTSVVGRINTASNNLYYAGYIGGASDYWRVSKVVAGTTTLLSSSASGITDETSHNCKLEMIGTAIKLYIDGSGSALISVTDSAHSAAGKAGVRFSVGTDSNTTDIHMDNFSADDVSSGSTGTLSTTNAADTSVASGTTTVTGALATTNAADTSTASGAVGTGSTGTLATTNANDTVAASGTTTITGTLARTNADDSIVAAGWAGLITGTVAYTNANDVSTASGISITGIVETYSGGFDYGNRRKTPKQLKRERIKLGILPPEVERIVNKVVGKAISKAQDASEVDVATYVLAEENKALYERQIRNEMSRQHQQWTDQLNRLIEIALIEAATDAEDDEILMMLM